MYLHGAQEINDNESKHQTKICCKPGDLIQPLHL